MCGLFGLIRSDSCDPHKATAMCVALGILAEERGVDSAGLAMAATGVTTELTRSPAVSRRDTTAGGWRIVKGPGSFREVWDKKYGTALNDAPAAIGHTRWATQGSTGKLANASPLQVGQLIGAHNGDVDAWRLREAFDLPQAVGDTDTEAVFQALDTERGVILPTLSILEAVVGRAALVWTDRRWPNLMMLARTAVSPLAITVDTDGNLYWASNPGWFAKAARAAGVTLKSDSIWLMPEGTLILVDYSSGKPRRAGMYDFTATARAKDDRLASVVAYRGFSAKDRLADRAVVSHVTLPDPRPAVRDSWRTPLWMHS
jgi:glucosamine--fructose-6-phosphate aminotransferase (isomerizing)